MLDLPKVEAVPSGLSVIRGTYPFRFNVSDPEGDLLYASIYYSENSGAKEHTAVSNLYLPGYCTDNDNTTSTEDNCTYFWNTSRINGDYYIDIEVTDAKLSDTDSSSLEHFDNNPEIGRTFRFCFY